MISSPLKYSADLSDDDESYNLQSTATSLRSYKTASQHTNHKRGQESWTSAPDEYDLTNGQDEEVYNRNYRNYTGDTVVEDLLQSFDRIPQERTSLKNQAAAGSTFREGHIVHVPAQKELPPTPRSRKSSYSSTISQTHSRSRSQSFHHPSSSLSSQLQAPIPPLPTQLLPGINPDSEAFDWPRYAPTTGRTEGSNSLVDNRPPKISSSPRSRTFTGIFKSMADRSYGSTINRADMSSPSPSYDLNPQDRSRRRRSRSLQTSVLDRARPVPAEYHDFDGSAQPAGTDARRKSTPHHPNTVESNAAADRALVETLYRPHATIGSQAIKRDTRRSTSFDVSRPSFTTALPSTTSKGSQASTPAKERPSFFRRVFSSSKLSTAADPNPPQLPPLNAINKENGTQQQVNSATTSNQPTPQKPIQIPAAPPIPNDDHDSNTRPVLHKKTSFFRRRKKTLNEKEPLSLDTQKAGTEVQTSQKSPLANGLGKVVDPHPVNGHSPQDKYFDSLERQPESPRAPSKQILLNQGSTRASSSRPTSQVDASHNERKGRTSSRDIFYDSSQTVSNHKGKTSSAKSSRDIGRYQVADDKTMRSDARDHGTSNDFILHVEDHTNINNASHKSRGSKGHWPKRSTSLTKKARLRAEGVKDGKQAASAPDDSKILDGEVQSASSLTNPERVRLNSMEPDTSTVPVPDVPMDGSSAMNSEQPSITSTPAASRSATPMRRKASMEPTGLPPGISDAPNDDLIQGLPAFDDKERAECLFNGAEDPVTRSKGAMALGSTDESSESLRIAYMALFDFSGLNILLALRDLCGRLVLKGETQQVDRVLASFSQRWCECNPTHGFKSADVVHTICYSLLLLNTDLHVADMDQKMTRNQFVRNTLPTVKRMAEEATDPDITIRPNPVMTRGAIPWQDPLRSPSPLSAGEASDVRPSLETRNSSSRLSVRQYHRPTSGTPSLTSPTPYDSRTMDVSELLVNAPYDGTIKGWEAIVETILKDSYVSIRQLRLPLHGASEPSIRDQTSNGSLSVMNTLMRRSSKGGSSDSMRGRAPGLGSAAARWASKTRSRPKLYASSTFGSSRTGSRTSLEESLWSPSASSTWSRPSFGPTQSTMSTDSLVSRYSPADTGYQQAIGFANALSHAIIREEGSMMPEVPPDGDIPLLDDEELELAGAPWAKEGMVHHKHHLETTDRKCKDRTWYENFAVVQKGWIRLFSFNKSSSRNKSSKFGGGGSNGPPGSSSSKAPVVGGGNWTNNAEAVGSFMLRQTQAIVLPPPGYSKTRPHVFALMLPNGAVHLFQVGTAEIVREFIQTVNYWSARLSKEPLVGGVSNVEYGWSENVINAALLSPNLPESSRTSIKESLSANTPTPPPAPRAQTPLSGKFPPSSATAARTIHHSPSTSISLSGRPSLQGSLRSRSSLDHPSNSSTFRRPGLISSSNSLPADRIVLADWTPPQQSLYPSSLSETEQLAALQRYVHTVDADFARHNDARSAMVLAYSPRSANAAKALANWERKSSYLLREIVKFKTYVDALEFAARERQRVKSGERGVGGAIAAEPPTRLNGVDVSAGTGGHLKGLSVDTTEGDLDEGTLEALKISKAAGIRARAGTGASSNG